MSALADRQREFAGYLVAGFPEFGLKGLPLVSASAAGGNATRENKCLPVTEGQKDHGSDGSMQWRLTRLDGPVGLKGWAAANRLPWDTLRTQAAFFLWELAKDYPVLDAELHAGTKRIETLTANICFVYERPAPEYAALDERIDAAKQIYADLSKQTFSKISDEAKAGSIVIGTGGAAAAAASHFSGGGIQVTAAIVLAAFVGVALLLRPRTKGTVQLPSPAPLPVPVPSLSIEETLTNSLKTALDAASSARSGLQASIDMVRQRRDAIKNQIEVLQAAEKAANDQIMALSAIVGPPPLEGEIHKGPDTLMLPDPTLQQINQLNNELRSGL